jgi:hypothetical protein
LKCKEASFLVAELLMKSLRQSKLFRNGLFASCSAAIALMGVVLAPIVQAQSGPEMISLAGGSTQQVRGFSSATVPLFEAIAERDSNQQRCMGYGSLAPDHMLDIKGDVSQLKLRIASRGQDTTMIVQGPDNRVVCVDDAPEGGMLVWTGIMPKPEPTKFGSEPSIPAIGSAIP